MIPHLLSSRVCKAALPVLVLLCSCTSNLRMHQSPDPQPPNFSATIRWTSHGIPHIKATNMAGAGYGLAYAVATDALCVLAEEFITVRGERAKYLGGTEENINSDAFYKALLDPQRLAQFRAANAGDSLAMDQGYVAGYNRYLVDYKGHYPSGCKDAPWVKPVDLDDMTRLDLDFGIRYGLGFFTAAITNATPGMTKPTAAIDLPGRPGVGSNALALGKAVTANGKGILLGNPHYPWQGGSRFHVAQITVPGRLDVFNASLITTTTPGIGFNRDVAWSHTVSSAQRYTLFRLDLVPGHPMQYRVGHATHTFVRRDVDVDALQDDGTMKTVHRTLYQSDLGPVVSSPQLPWDDSHAYVIRDVNYENDRGNNQYNAMDRARSVTELKAALDKFQGIAFVNTIAADRAGHALYADIGAIPDIDKDLIARCRVAPEVLEGDPVIILDGSRPECHWRRDIGAAAPGVMPPQHEPSLQTDTWVENSNDSYWLSNPETPLTGFSPIIGNEGTARSLRTRAGLNFVEQFLDSGQKFTPGAVEDLLTSNRNYGAEIFLDDVLTICAGAEKTLDVAAACGILHDWDRRQGVDSVGAQVYQEFWKAVQARIGKYYATPFSASDPVHTPRGIRTNDAGAQRVVMDGLETALKNLNQANVLPMARWGDVQFALRNGKKIPVPGGDEASGMFSVIYGPLNPKTHGYNPIVYGNSYMQVVTWDEDGTPDAHIMLSYSQSPEPDSPFYDDMTELYSKSEWIKVPFSDKQIEADLVKTVELDSNTR